MEKSLSQISNISIKLFDGFEDALYKQKFEIRVIERNIILNTLELLDNKFKNLSFLLGGESKLKIAKDKGFKYENGLFPGYSGTDGLDIYYLISNSQLLIFSMGEYQPSRYILYFEGAWNMS